MAQDTGQVRIPPGKEPSGLVRLREKLARASCLCVLLIISGCATAPPPPPDIPDVVAAEPDPLPPPAVPEEPLPEPAPAPAVRQLEPEPPSHLSVAIVLSDRSPAFENVAIELGKLLDRPLVYNLADKSQPPEDAFAGMAGSGTAVVIAIGFAAAKAAMALSPVPVVYCQVFNTLETDAADVTIKGVASIPPLALQIREWKKVDPDLRSIGAIVGEGHEKLIAEASLAAAANDIVLHYRVSGSDRETLYLFRRMAPGVDGFWLFPDNRILSVRAMDKMVDVAARHQVRIAVFNHSLLEMGASLSTAAAESDIAAKIVRVAGKLIVEGEESVPDLTPLGVVEIRQNPDGARGERLAADGDEAVGRAKGRL